MITIFVKPNPLSRKIAHRQIVKKTHYLSSKERHHNQRCMNIIIDEV